MLIERPRTPRKVMHRGKEVYRVGRNQMLALYVLSLLKPTEAPPKGLITATGDLREHIFRDMYPQAFLDMHRKAAGTVGYSLLPAGKEVLRDGITIEGDSRKDIEREAVKRVEQARRGDDVVAKKAKHSNGTTLLAKQRAKAKAKRAAPAAGRTRHAPRAAARRA